jgi:hypothetical protein
MVKNDSHSLRGSTSSLSLRLSAHEQAARYRIAELEAQVAALTAQASSSAAISNNNSDVQNRNTPSIPLGDVKQFDRGLQAISAQSNDVQPQRTLYEEAERLYGPQFRQRDLYSAEHVLQNPKRQRGRDEQLQSRPSLFEKYNKAVQEQKDKSRSSLITKGLVQEGNSLKSPEAYTQPFCDFLTENPTVWHAVSYFENKLTKAGFKKVRSLCAIDTMITLYADY